MPLRGKTLEHPLGTFTRTTQKGRGAEVPRTSVRLLSSSQVDGDETVSDGFQEDIPTAVAMAIAKGWNSLIVPTMIAGVWGYVLGNYAGIIVGNILQVIL